MNEITITMNKFNGITVNKRLPVTKNTKQTIEYLRYMDFAMIRFTFDNWCYDDATSGLRQREYNKYVARINKVASELGLTVATIENQIIKDIVMPYHFVAVVLK